MRTLGFGHEGDSTQGERVRTVAMGHLHRPRRSARALATWATLLAGGAALLAAIGLSDATAAEGTPDPSADRSPGATAQAGAVQLRGDQIYARTCARCHGPDAQGGTGQGGTDLTAGPALHGLEAAYVDLLLRSGRMPITSPEHGVPQPERLEEREREAVVAFMTDRFGLRGGIPSIGVGDPARGRELYAIHCAACHGSTGSGGVSGQGTLVRAVVGLDRIAIAEAIRTGPFEMPRFAETVLNDDDVDDLATYVADHMSTAPRTPLGLAEMNRVTMWGMAVALGAAALGLTVLAARPLRRGESEEQS